MSPYKNPRPQEICIDSTIKGIKNILNSLEEFFQINKIITSQATPINNDNVLRNNNNGLERIKFPIPKLNKNNTNKTGANCRNFNESGCKDRVFVFHKPYLKNCFNRPNK